MADRDICARVGHFRIFESGLKAACLARSQIATNDCDKWSLAVEVKEMLHRREPTPADADRDFSTGWMIIGWSRRYEGHMAAAISPSSGWLCRFRKLGRLIGHVLRSAIGL